MSVYGLACNSSRISCCLLPGSTRVSSSLRSSFSHRCFNPSILRKLEFCTQVERRYGSGSKQRYLLERNGKGNGTICASASFGDMADDSTVIFPRIHVKDPYKRLGISREASEEEIQAARNFLINQYARHKPSVDAIESAHDKIIMQSFYERRNPKINLKKKFREVSQSRVIRAVTSRFEAPATNFILKTAIAFIVLGVLTVLFPTEEGPTLQVAISLALSIYFIHARLRSRLRAFLYGIAAFFVSWLLGTFLMVSVIPPLLQGARSFEVTTSLVSYVLLWISSTYLK